MRIALAVEYAGDAFCGWQSQASACSVQDALERALGSIAAQRIATAAAGRTDAGVHAALQIHVALYICVQTAFEIHERNVASASRGLETIAFHSPIDRAPAGRLTYSARHATF